MSGEILYRPRGMDGTRWNDVRRRWNAAAELPEGSTAARRALAEELRMSFDTLQRYAKRCGWRRQGQNRLK